MKKLSSEQSLLMARMFYPGVFDETISHRNILADDWESEDLGRVWEAMVKVRACGQEIDIVNVFQKIDDRDVKTRLLALDLATFFEAINTTVNLKAQINHAFTGEY